MNSLLEGNDEATLNRRKKQFRVAEIFGPTIQGEGRNIGRPCSFVRFGGCDFRCSWCDTPHAVLPDLVAQLPQLTAWQIIHRLNELDGSPDWVVLSGGNPGLLDLSEVIGLLHTRKQRVMVETQGSTYRDWYNDVDDLCFSPKPPSSGNTSDLDLLDRILDMLVQMSGTLHKAYLKVVAFDETDYEFAVEVHQRFPMFDFFISVGNEDPSLPTVGRPNPIHKGYAWMTQDVVLQKLKWIMEKVASDPRMTRARVLPQLHTLAWGNERGR